MSRVRALGLVVAVYVGIYGVLLGVTRGVPYVTDGNESFSMLVHASNLYHFPLSQTFGLSDEAYSRDPAAHPYAYTHQGNFPRLFSFLLYAIGARSVESQIIITTLTIGLLSVFLIFEYFTLVTTTPFAVVATIVVLTDYLLFGQWQVNTYRVWHGLFFFLSLVGVHRLEGNRRGAWLAITFLTFAGVFYFELVFGAYVAITAGLYAGLRYWKRPKLLLTCWTVQFAGAVTAVLTLMGQLIGYLGWTDFVQDLRLTYTARNVGGADQAYVDRIREFVDSRHIVFWYNFAREYQRSAFELLSSITRGYFSSYTPTFWYLVAIVTTGWLVAVFFGRSQAAPDAPIDVRHVSGSLWPTAIPTLLLIVAWSRFLLAIVQPDALAGVEGARVFGAANTGLFSLIAAAAIGAACVGVTTRLVTGHWLRLLPGARAVLATGVVLIAEYVVLESGTSLDPSFMPLWSHIQGALYARWIVQVLVIAAAAFATAAVLVPGVIAETNWPALGHFFVCGLLAYVGVYLLSPGYVETGYLQRLVPFASFVFETAIALVIYLAWSMLHRLLAAAPRFEVARTPIRSVATATAFCALVFVATYWVRVQSVHVSLVPPTHFMFIQQLSKPPFRGASFAVNTYAAPVYAYTGEWAYYDFRLGDKNGGAVTVIDDGYRVVRDGTRYLWLADRLQNAEYERPDYFLCYEHQDLHTAVNRLTGGREGCSLAGPVKYANNRTQPSVAREVVARDESGDDSWAIVKLDWSILDRHTHRAELGQEP